MKLSERAEEILEAMWIAMEEKGQGFAEMEKIGIAAGDPAYKELTDRAFIEIKEAKTPSAVTGLPRDS
jgi:DtxR family Mn-dependent transcriptional regulator